MKTKPTVILLFDNNEGLSCNRVLTFEIVNTCRAVLQEIARHRQASLSVRSTRYTLKELKAEEQLSIEAATKYLYLTGNDDVDLTSIAALRSLKALADKGLPNDLTKFAMPESYLTELVWTINIKSLENFILLRTASSALWAIRDLAEEVFLACPSDIKGHLNTIIINIR